MDDKDKGMVEKTIEAVEEFVSDIKAAARHMMDPPAPLQPGDEIVMLPAVDYGILGAPMPPEYVVVHHPRKVSGKKSAKTAAKKPAKKPAKTAMKRAAKKKAAKKSKGKSVVKKVAKKAVKNKKAKKSRPSNGGGN
jgi:hypothetical protein